EGRSAANGCARLRSFKSPKSQSELFANSAERNSRRPCQQSSSFSLRGPIIAFEILPGRLRRSRRRAGRDRRKTVRFWYPRRKEIDGAGVQAQPLVAVRPFSLRALRSPFPGRLGPASLLPSRRARDRLCGRPPLVFSAAAEPALFRLRLSASLRDQG